jgi:malonyl CoA-acyl carrier protein transacylase
MEARLTSDDTSRTRVNHVLAVLFPGQGSQKKGMGAELFDSVPEFAAVEAQVDQLLGYSLRRACMEDPGGVLTQTEFTQPCLYTVNALYFYRHAAGGRRPDLLAGHSLGEYNALLAAGAFDFMTGLQLVHRRGELMADAPSGAMAAIIDLDAEIIQATIDRGRFSVNIANYNAPNQIVISGVTEDVQRLAPLLRAAGARACVPLKVSAAFHSRLMEEAAEQYEAFLGDFTFHPLQTPVIANVTGLPYPPGDPSSVIRWALVKQFAGQVRWMQSIRYMRDQGASELLELGPGTVLTDQLARILGDWPPDGKGARAQ